MIYLRQRQAAFDPVPIPHQKRHYYGTDVRSTVAPPDFHLKYPYFVWKPMNKTQTMMEIAITNSIAQHLLVHLHWLWL